MYYISIPATSATLVVSSPINDPPTDIHEPTKKEKTIRRMTATKGTPPEDLPAECAAAAAAAAAALLASVTERCWSASVDVESTSALAPFASSRYYTSKKTDK